MGLQGPADWMVVPVTVGPVDDEHPAGQVNQEREEEKCSPAVTHLGKINMTTQQTTVFLLLITVDCTVQWL